MFVCVCRFMELSVCVIRQLRGCLFFKRQKWVAIAADTLTVKMAGLPLTPLSPSLPLSRPAGQINTKNEELEAMVKEASGPINFTVFLTMFGEKLKGGHLISDWSLGLCVPPCPLPS